MSKILLVVDDEESVRSILAVLLRRVGYDVLEAGDARQTLICLRSFDFAAVLMDGHLGNGTNSLELIDEIRQRKPQQRIIATSSDPRMIEQMMASGRCDYACDYKPDANVLVQFMRQLIPPA